MHVLCTEELNDLVAVRVFVIVFVCVCVGVAVCVKGCSPCSVAILAQGTSWAVAVTQAF